VFPHLWKLFIDISTCILDYITDALSRIAHKQLDCTTHKEHNHHRVPEKKLIVLNNCLQVQLVKKYTIHRLFAYHKHGEDRYGFKTIMSSIFIE